MNMPLADLLPYAVFGLFIPLGFTLSFIVFIWGSFQYVIQGGHDEEAREKSKSLMLYGILVFIAMAVLWLFATFVAGLFSPQ